MTKPVHAHAAGIAHALAQPSRLRTMNLLIQREWGVSELAEELSEAIGTTSANLQVLKQVNLVDSRRDGRRVLYSVQNLEAIKSFTALMSAAEVLLPDMRELVREASEDPSLYIPVSLKSLNEDCRAGRIQLVDLRPAAEFESGALPAAMSIPFGEVEPGHVSQLKGSQTILAYCRGPWCAIAREGTSKLQSQKLPVQRLAIGIAEWRTAGLELSQI